MDRLWEFASANPWPALIGFVCSLVAAGVTACWLATSFVHLMNGYPPGYAEEEDEDDEP